MAVPKRIAAWDGTVTDRGFQLLQLLATPFNPQDCIVSATVRVSPSFAVGRRKTSDHRCSSTSVFAEDSERGSCYARLGGICATCTSSDKHCTGMSCYFPHASQIVVAVVVHLSFF